ncbi:MAG TPA: rRNA methyltransferase [Muricauda sp.]|uniref:tRNA (guanosine(18)-2'-O)-methyltransferase n=1 Tax=Flagellimonas aurea TaxID=2915619 RepID=A0ABS3G450_9FLAO|nr:RNA methyltransferase [Allomuricauda aurea]MAO15671.1 rRNA methyltransferase [Allomuricauda sp.]MBO0354198.1 RNA methyltransferase [Allomuricauda aurea]UBZ14153.1 RNA methyltransferase [Allomuricauda aquimarina]HBU78878.1 rRNA methyltransferase [Allomuricauda sp.]|tara:strand:+ start:2368 stop:3021 length:654 start_codon:yes stop_codon:yes gene_type:complete
MFDDDLLTYLESYLTEERKQRFLDVLQQRTRHITIAIEDVYQLHNTSAILRSCDAFGVQDLHVIENRFGKRLDKNIAMGAEQWVDVYRYKNVADCISKLREDGYQIIATTPHNDSTLLPDFSPLEKSAIFFGTERKGLSNEVMEQADGFLKIPMVGFSESLNVSVSAAIIIQQLAQKVRDSQVEWQLSDIEMLEKRLDWTKKSIKNVDGIIKRYLVK